MSLMYENDENKNENKTENPPIKLPNSAHLKPNAAKNDNPPVTANSNVKENNPTSLNKMDNNNGSHLSVNDKSLPPPISNNMATTATSTTSTVASSTTAGATTSAASSAVAGSAAGTVASTAGGPVGLALTAALSFLKNLNPINESTNENTSNGIGISIILIIAVPLILAFLASFLIFSSLPGVVTSLYLGQYETTYVTSVNEEQNDEESNGLLGWISEKIKGIKNNTIKIINNFSRAFYDDTDILGYEDIVELPEFNKTDEFKDSYEANMKLLDEAMIQSYNYQKEQFEQWCEDNDFDVDYAMKSFPSFDSIGEIDYLTYLACIAQSNDYNLKNYVSKKLKNFLLSESTYPYLLSMEINNVTIIEDTDTDITTDEESDDNNTDSTNEKSNIAENKISLFTKKKITCDITLSPFTTSSLADLFGFDINGNHYETGIGYKTSMEETKLMIQATCGDLQLCNNITYTESDSNNTYSDSTEDLDLKNYKTDVMNDIENGYYTAEDYAYMVAVMSSEGNLSYDCAVAVGYCVMYRCKVNNQTVKQVVTAPSQFCSPWAKYIGKPVNQICATAAVAVLKGEAPNKVGDCYFFFSASAVKCTKPGAYYKNIGGNVYYKKWGDVHTVHNNKHDCISYKR